MPRPRSSRQKKAAVSKVPRFEKSLHSPLHLRFVELMREARIGAGLAQIDAAARLGVRQSFISDIERGERRVDVVEFVKFCRAYRVDPADFFKKLKRQRVRGLKGGV